MNLLKGDHDDVDHGDVVDGPPDELGLVELGSSLAHVVANTNAPQQEQKLTWKRQTDDNEQ